jgi:nucleoside-diphosphate-sugar epimerase
MFVRFLGSVNPGAFDRLYGSFYLNNSKTKKLLKYKPLFSTEEGIRKMISSYLENKISKKLS